ncbi:MAG: TolC family protein [Deltaproteobacteria bacterium]|nr:TolC family protein [Deltaproteobacteria bacterium]
MKLFSCLIILVFSLTSEVSAADKVTMDWFLSKVRSTHPLFKKEALSPKISRVAQESSLGDEDWIIRSNPHYSYSKFAKTGGFNPNSIDETNIGASLERSIWKTGGTLSLSYDYKRTDQEASDVSFGTVTIPGDSGIFHENSINLSYSHPLVRNRAGSLSRLEYELGGYDVRADDITSIEDEENFLLQVGEMFLDWVDLTEQRIISMRRLDLARSELKRTEKKRQKNLVDRVDVIRSQDAVLGAEQVLLQVEASMKGVQAELASIAQLQEFEGLEPHYDLYSLVELPSIESATARLHETSRILNSLKVRLDQLERRKQGFVESAKPQVDMNVSGGITGGDEDFSNSHDYNKPRYAAGLTFSYPLGNRRAKADITRTSLEKRFIGEELRSNRLALESALKNIMTHIRELEKVLAVDERRIRKAREKTEAELERYNQGRTELTFVIQSRDGEQNAQLIHARNAAVYHKLILRYRALMDELLQIDS